MNDIEQHLSPQEHLENGTCFLARFKGTECIAPQIAANSLKSIQRGDKVPLCRGCKRIRGGTIFIPERNPVDTALGRIAGERAERIRDIQERIKGLRKS